MLINKKVFALFVTIREAKARLTELEALRPYLNTKTYNNRRRILKKKIEELSEEKQVEQVINVIIR